MAGGRARRCVSAHPPTRTGEVRDIASWCGMLRKNGLTRLPAAARRAATMTMWFAAAARRAPSPISLCGCCYWAIHRLGGKKMAASSVYDGKLAWREFQRRFLLAASGSAWIDEGSMAGNPDDRSSRGIPVPAQPKLRGATRRVWIVGTAGRETGAAEAAAVVQAPGGNSPFLQKEPEDTGEKDENTRRDKLEEEGKFGEEGRCSPHRSDKVMCGSLTDSNTGVIAWRAGRSGSAMDFDEPFRVSGQVEPAEETVRSRTRLGDRGECAGIQEGMIGGEEEEEAGMLRGRSRGKEKEEEEEVHSDHRTVVGRAIENMNEWRSRKTEEFRRSKGMDGLVNWSGMAERAGRQMTGAANLMGGSDVAEEGRERDENNSNSTMKAAPPEVGKWSMDKEEIGRRLEKRLEEVDLLVEEIARHGANGALDAWHHRLRKEMVDGTRDGDKSGEMNSTAALSEEEGERETIIFSEGNNERRELGSVGGVGNESVKAEDRRETRSLHYNRVGRQLNRVAGELGEKGDWEGALELVRWVEEKGWLNSDPHTLTTVIDVLGKHGRADEVEEVFAIARGEREGGDGLASVGLRGEEEEGDVLGEGERRRRRMSRGRRRRRRRRSDGNIQAGGEGAGVVDTSLINAMMTARVRCGRYMAALQLFEDARKWKRGSSLGRREGVGMVDATSFNVALDAVMRAGLGVEGGEQLLGEMSATGLRPDVVTCNSFLGICAEEIEKMDRRERDDSRRHRVIEAASQMYEEMVENGIQRTIVTYGTMIKVFSKAGDVDGLAEVYRDLRKDGLPVNEFIVTSMISGLGAVGRVMEAERIFKEMVKNGCEANIFTYNSLIGMYARNGELEKAERIFRAVKRRGLRASVVTYTSLMSAYARKGLFDEVLEIFEMMKEEGCSPNAITFLTLIGGCVKGGHSQGVAARLVDEIVDTQCKPIPSLSAAVMSACAALAKKEIAHVCQQMSRLGAVVFSHAAKLLLHDDLDHQQVTETAAGMLGEMGSEWGKIFKARFAGAVCHALLAQGSATRASVVLGCVMEASLVPLGACAFEPEAWVLDLRSMSVGIAITMWWLWVSAIQRILVDWRAGGENGLTEWKVSVLFPLLPPTVVRNTEMQDPVNSVDLRCEGHGESWSNGMDGRGDQEDSYASNKVAVALTRLPTELVLLIGVSRSEGEEMESGLGGMKEEFQREMKKAGAPFRMKRNRAEMSASLGAVVMWLRSGPQRLYTGMGR